MYKYLADKLEAKTIEGPEICLISFESQREEASEVWERFLDNKTEDICKTLSFNIDEKTISLIEEWIEEGEARFAYACMQNNRQGFIAEVKIPKREKIVLNENGEFKSCNISCISYVRWAYSDTLGELTDKILQIDEECYEKDLAKQNKL